MISGNIAIKILINIFVVVYTTINMKIPGSIAENVIFLTGLISNRLSYSINKSFRDEGIDITVEQFSILAILWYREGLNQQSIAEALNRDKTTIARVIGNMFDKNLLVKVPDGSDRRNNLVFLTKKGKELQDRCIKITGNYYVKALGSIPEEKLEKTLNVLNEIFKNIS